MRAVFGVASLLVLAIVGMLASLQHKAVNTSVSSSAGRALPGAASTVREQSQQIQQRVVGDMAKAMQQGARKEGNGPLLRTDRSNLLCRKPWVNAFVALGCSATIANAQVPVADAPLAVARLRRDQVSLAVFKYLGKTHCLDVVLDRRPGDFATEYGILYNRTYPLPRLISEDALRATFATLERRLPGIDSVSTKSTLRFVDPIRLCSSLYEANPRAKKAYATMVRDPGSMHSSADVDLSKHIRDYLEGYFIKAPD